MSFTFTRINASPEVMSRVWMQLTDLKDAIQLPDARKQALLTWAIDLTRKLESVKYHRDNLIRIVNENFEKLSEKTHSPTAAFVEVNTGAEKEFEAFLLQGKSIFVAGLRRKHSNRELRGERDVHADRDEVFCER